MAGDANLAVTVLTGLVLVGISAWLSRIEDWRSYAPLAAGADYGEETGGAHGTGGAHEEKPAGLIRWLTTVDHKDIGIMYGAFAVLSFAWGGTAVILMRTELLGPETDFLQPTLYNALLTSHGITMLFLFGTPILAAFGNYFVPLLIDADDMAFPRINAIAFWLLSPGALLIWGGFLLAPLGAYVLALGQLVFVWNVVTSWLEGPAVADGDPWDLAEHGAMTNEWRWFERQRQATVADGGGEEAAD